MQISKVSLLQNSKTLIVKVGSSLVTNNGEGLDRSAIAAWAEQISVLVKQGKQVVLVSSGAVAEGMQRLGWKKRPIEVNELQAAAAVGQMGLVQMYESCFAQHGLHTAQILLTHDDLRDRKRYLNARSTLKTLLALNVIPIINENDTVVTEEIRFGDNDTLGALVANLIEADALVILTDQQGLYSADPRKDSNAQFIHFETAGNPVLEQMAGGAGSSIGTGGMLTKILAAKRAASSGAHTVIASGREANVLVRLSAGEAIGTHLEAGQMKIVAKKQWLADHLRFGGQLVLDDGAANVLTKEGKSLLAIGVIDVQGTFERGDVVACINSLGKELARGIVNYNSQEVARIKRKPSHEIEHILGYVEESELIHRDNMVLL
ncbi:MAG: glutamate 5-kinase [Methylophilaceae bacterium 17-44-8]|jgi:glutamate 5-kinase|nr:MAG: glutamate 5-kinase [Methylophilales bacterium 28-44-11]OZA05122.1 MAG: glutamate 5-kinase [Methylophilaceae bacterium 17-44-8]